MPFNLPIALTWLRVAAIPLLVVIFYLPNSWFTPFEKNMIAAIIFIAAAITDWLDGFLARRLKQESLQVIMVPQPGNVETVGLDVQDPMAAAQLHHQRLKPAQAIGNAWQQSHAATLALKQEQLGSTA